jgi:hypothetical protein
LSGQDITVPLPIHRERRRRRIAQPGPLSVALLVTAALLSATLVANLLAYRVSLGAGVLAALCCIPLVLINLRAGIALWLVLTFLQGYSVSNFGGKAVGLLIVLAWLASARRDRAVVHSVLLQHRRLLVAIVFLLMWLTVSIAWARDPGFAAGSLWQWFAVAFIFLVVTTTMSSERSVRVLIGAFVFGGVITVVVGFAGNTTASGTTRLAGGLGDPNFLAAALVPGIALAAGLMAGIRNPALRLCLFASIFLLSAGVVASQSRGGAIAVVVTGLAALVFCRRQRIYVIALILLIAGGGAILFSTTPGSWKRITHYSDEGNGRSEAWRIAGEIAGDHPVVGVGLNQFERVAGDYVHKPGLLKFSGIFVDRPHEVHNTYLQLLAETGIIGLLLFLTVIAACLRAAWLAGNMFERLGDRASGTLARAVLVAIVAILAASFFVTNPVDQRLWVLLSLGPALLVLASRRLHEAMNRQPVASQ